MPSPVRGFIVLALWTAGALALRASDPPPLPDTPKKPVTEEYHGVKVVDNYRWLDNADDPAVKKWTEAQNKHSRAVLDEFPQMAALRKRVQELLAAPSATHYHLQYRGGRLFAMKSQPPKDQPFLVTLKSADDPGSRRAIVAPNELNPQ